MIVINCARFLRQRRLWNAFSGVDDSSGLLSLGSSSPPTYGVPFELLAADRRSIDKTNECICLRRRQDATNSITQIILGVLPSTDPLRGVVVDDHSIAPESKIQARGREFRRTVPQTFSLSSGFTYVEVG